MNGNDVKHVARACLAVTPLVWACYEYESRAVVSRTEAIIVGDTVSLSVIARDGAMTFSPSVAWMSSDSSIATIDQFGVVTGTGPGWVQIQARTGDFTLEAPLLVWATAGPFLSIDSGVNHNCGLAEDGSAWCWGRNEFSQLGTGVSPDLCPVIGGAFLKCSLGAIPVDTDPRFTELAVGFYHNCGLSTVGTAHCWGLNDRGQLGDGGTETRATPEPVAGAHVFKSLTAGGRTTCGITVDDALLCWGSGLFRVIDVSPGELTTPTHVAAEREFILAETSGNHTCGVTPGGATYCWGSNSHGQLGVAAVDSICGSSPCTREPQEVASTTPFVDLALGGGFSCGLTSGGVAHCWGGNAYGQLGDGTRTDRWEVRPVGGGRSFTRLDAGEQYACGVDGAGLLYCWGRDPWGFGNGGDRVEVDQPVPGASGLTFTEIAIGLSTQCGLADSGVAWCWGANLDGAVGNGRSQRMGGVSTPMRVIRHPAR